MTGPHILIVDDDPAVLRVLERSLTKVGARVSAAADGEAARKIALADPVHALVLDYRMPGLRGDALFDLLASTDPGLRKRTLFMTGDISEAADERLLATGCPVMSKPFSLLDFIAAVAELLGEPPDTTAKRKEGQGRAPLPTPMRGSPVIPAA